MKVIKYLVIITSVIFFGGCGTIMPSKSFDKENTTYKESAVYTVKGVKDKRLEAMYRVYYSNYRKYPNRYIQGSECKDHTKKYANILEIKNEIYEVKIPMFISENNCDFKVDWIELVIRRNYDEYYSKYTIFNSSHQSHITYFGTGRPDIKKTFNGRRYSTIYDGWKAGIGQDITKEPLQLWTDKKYFLMAPETNFLCQTKLYHYKTYSHKEINTNDFLCVLRIKDGQGDNLVQIDDMHYDSGVNPQFGINEIIDTTLKINILVNNKACSAYFDHNRSNEPYPFIEIEKPFFFQNIF